MTEQHTPNRRPATRGRYGARTDILDRLKAAHATPHIGRVSTNVLFTDSMREIRALREQRDEMLEALRAVEADMSRAAAMIEANRADMARDFLLSGARYHSDLIAKATGGDQ